MTVVWSGRAKAHLRHIVDYIWEHNPAAAARVSELIVDRAEQLSAYPEIGRPGRVQGTRELIVVGLPYIIAYRLRQGQVEIAAVLHAARRWPRSFDQ